MFNDLRWLAPLPQPILEVLVVYELSREFHREVEYREKLEHYYQWYYETARRHQLELQRMQNDLNVMGWFNRSFKRKPQ